MISFPDETTEKIFEDWKEALIIYYRKLHILIPVPQGLGFVHKKLWGARHSGAHL